MAASGTPGEQLHHSLVLAGATAQRLGVPVDTVGALDLADLRALIAAVTEHLGDRWRGEITRAVEEHQASLQRLRQRFDSRFDALARVSVAIAALREVTSPSEMLARAPGMLCDGSALRRAILSLISDGRVVPQAVYLGGDARGAREMLEQLRLSPARLEHPLLETELLRRRRATIVLDAPVNPRVDPHLTRLMGWSSYVVAPFVVASHVVGVIHADRGRETPLDVLDRDVLWAFSTDLAQAYESAVLRRSLRRERDQMRQFLEWLNARSGELSDAPISLAAPPLASSPPPEPLDRPAPTAGRDDRVIFEGLLTRRELDVLRLLADGKSNKAIAAALVLSGGTVKFHVNGILRKLHAANRAEAVSRYLRLLGMQPP